MIHVGIITVSDRASQGVYDDLGGPAVRKAAEGYGWEVFSEAVVPVQVFPSAVVADASGIVASPSVTMDFSRA